VAIKILAYQHGIYPRSEQVVAATRGLDRGRVDADAVDAAFAEDLAGLVRGQKEAGLDFFSDGLLRWQDIFRPLMEALGLRKPEPLVRWFDTNTFFREPDLSGQLPTLTRPDGVVPDGSLPRPRVATLPSPYMFSRAARTDHDRNRLMVDLAAKIVRPAAEAAVKAGAELVHLEEPWLAYVGIQAGDWAPLEEALGQLHQGLQATLVFHTYFGDAAPHIDRLRRLPVDAIGVDLVETDVAALGSNWDKGLVAGVMNGRSSILESAEATAELAMHLKDRVSPRNLYLSSTCELGFLPTGLAERKIQRLGEAARKAKELVSV
jgi:5-methyltetrahydropteroyltriglutamate--homocysteine methyltransferase